jgi:putative multiple sugar transport system permease protein
MESIASRNRRAAPAAPSRKGLRQLLKNNMREYGMLLSLVAIMGFFQS